MLKHLPTPETHCHHENLTPPASGSRRRRL